ncbi:MAG: hypothetical protein PUB96_08660 [Helicobacteraceae bacterium]|nr:hypothetical protein [Helicobacteraceae bacterium]
MDTQQAKRQETASYQGSGGDSKIIPVAFSKESLKVDNENLTKKHNDFNATLNNADSYKASAIPSTDAANLESLRDSNLNAPRPASYLQNIGRNTGISYFDKKRI